MNELEQRIYRAATRAASQVSAADMPPLQLSGRREQRGGSHETMQWSGTRRGIVRTLAPLAAAASVVALVIVLVTVSHGTAGKTSQGPTSRHHSPTAPARRDTSADPLIGQEALDSYFPASGASYTGGLAFTWTQEKIRAHDASPCLATAGFPQPPFRGSRRLFQLSFGDNSQFPDLRQLAAHPGGYNFTQQYPVLHNPTSARMKAFAHAQARCIARYAQPVTRVDKAALGLVNAWLNIITAIEHSGPVTATQPAFARCLESHGVPANLATRTDNSASNPLFYGYFSWADGTNQTARTARQIAADQRHETQVFVACAGPTVSVLERIQLQRRAQFFREHAAQVVRIVRLAQEMTSRS